MHVNLKYGAGGLDLEAPETEGFLGVLLPSEADPLPDPARELEEALRNPIASEPLAAVARGKKSACIVVSDVTRPVPNRLLLPPLLRILEEAGVPRSGVLLLVATGMHRDSTPDEIERLVGPEIARTYRVEDHHSRRREEMVEVGRIGGSVPALVNRRYVESDLKILTGFIEPHIWAGYSGGRKALLPGISSIDTLEHMHGPEMVAHPGCRYGLLEGNPFHEAGLEVLGMAGGDFLVNVTMDREKRVTGIFAGHPVEAHLAGCRFLSRYCVRRLQEPLDFIVTTNAGAPLDCNFYQTVKGMAGAVPAVRPGGDILVASRCSEGAGTPEFRECLERANSPREFLESVLRRDFFLPDQWCAQEMYKILLERGIWVYTEGLTPEDLRRYHFRPVASVQEGVDQLLEKHGPKARWAVVPDGPLTILEVG